LGWLSGASNSSERIIIRLAIGNYVGCPFCLRRFLTQIPNNKKMVRLERTIFFYDDSHQSMDLIFS